MQLKDKLFTLYIFVGAFFVGGFTSNVNHQHHHPVNTPVDVLLRKNEPSTSSHVDRAVNINIFMNDNSDAKETISCSDRYYFANDACYELNRNLDDHCLTYKDCEPIENAVCSNSRCTCRAEYFKSQNRCQRVIGANCSKYSDCKISNSKCKSGICQCDGAYYPANNNTECRRLNDSDREYSADYISHVRDLNIFCDPDVGCEIPFSTCVDGKCYCEPNYIKHDNVCYGLPHANCFESSDCISTSYSCQLGTCQNADYEKNGKLLSAKPGISAYWVKGTREVDVIDGVVALRDFDADVGVCRKTINRDIVPGKSFQITNRWARCADTPIPDDKYFNDYEMLIGSDVQWTNSTYTLDKAVYGGITEDNKPYLICRVTNFRLTAAGKLEPPLYSSCDVSYFNQIFSFDEFDVLVHK